MKKLNNINRGFESMLVVPVSPKPKYILNQQVKFSILNRTFCFGFNITPKR